MMLSNFAHDKMMTCEDFIPFIDSYVDGEFDIRDQAEMEAHLLYCSECRQRVEARITFKQDFKASLSDCCAPESLRFRIMDELEKVHCAQQQSVIRQFLSGKPVWQNGWAIGTMAAAIALIVVFPQFTIAPATSSQLPVIEQTVDWHQGNFPLEVVAASPEDISHWFRGKVDFSVRLPHFPEDSVNLLGGRIAHIQDRRAAYLLYEVEGTRLSVLLFDGDGLHVPKDSIRTFAARDMVLMNNRGYGIAILQDNGVTYAITSELPEEQLVSLITRSLTH